MATTKKPAAKKPVTKAAASKKAPVKKTPVKKTTAVKTAAKKVTPKRTAKAAAGYRSFKVSSAETPFTSFKITRQTVYWVILIAFIIFVQLWILKLQIDVATLLEQQQADLMNNL